jgi:uncharacterized protein (TIGR00156 family)
MASKVTWTGPLLLCVSAVAVGQYVGPGAPEAPKPAGPLRSVADILKDAADDVPVEIEGHIVRKVGKEKYTFSDGTGEIRVEIDDDEFPAARVDEKTRVRIRGEVDRDFRQSPEIDVDHVAVL